MHRRAPYWIGISLESVGWVALALVFVTGTAVVIAAALDQTRMLCRKLVKTLRAVREVRDEVRRFRSADVSGRQGRDDPGDITKRAR